MHAGVARKPFQRLRVLKELFRLRLGRDRALQLRILFRGGIERDAEFVRNHSRDPIGVAIGQAHHTADVTNDTLRFQFSKRDNLRDPPLAVLLAHVLQNLAATRFAKIDIDVRRRHAIRIQKAFEDQTELQRIDVGDSENVGNERTRRRSTPGPDRNAAAFGEVNEIPNDQDVTDESGLLEHAQFVGEPLAQLVVDLRALAVTLLESFITKITQITFARLTFRNRIFRIFRFPEFNRDIAALADRQSVRNRVGMIFK